MLITFASERFSASLPYKQRTFIIYDNDVTLTNMFKYIYRF